LFKHLNRLKIVSGAKFFYDPILHFSFAYFKAGGQGGDGVLRNFQQYFSYIMVVSLLVKESGVPREKLLTYCKPLRKFIT
jgi:hypothetical protein